VHDDHLWQYGVPPAGNANFAWVQHIVHHLAPEELVRSVQTPDRSHTIARLLHDRWQTDRFPQRRGLARTPAFANDRNLR
jgi:hypothetical protein